MYINPLKNKVHVLTVSVIQVDCCLCSEPKQHGFTFIQIYQNVNNKATGLNPRGGDRLKFNILTFILTTTSDWWRKPDRCRTDVISISCSDMEVWHLAILKMGRKFGGVEIRATWKADKNGQEGFSDSCQPLSHCVSRTLQTDFIFICGSTHCMHNFLLKRNDAMQPNAILTWIFPLLKHSISTIHLHHHQSQEHSSYFEVQIEIIFIIRVGTRLKHDFVYFVSC